MKTVPSSCVLLRVLAESRDQQPGSYWLAAPPHCAPIGWAGTADCLVTYFPGRRQEDRRHNAQRYSVNLYTGTGPAGAGGTLAFKLFLMEFQVY